MTINRKSERHHYVPQFYLKHWCREDGKLLVHPVDGSATFRARPSSFALEKGLYNSSRHCLTEGFDYEAGLSKLESLYSPVWPDVFGRINLGDTKGHLSIYLALTYLRHPNHKEIFRALNSLYEGLPESLDPASAEILLKGPYQERRIAVSEIRREVDKGEDGIDERFLVSMRKSVREIAAIFQTRKWGVFVSDQPVFITSDCPMALWRGSSKSSRFGLGTVGTQITYPLCPYKLLMIDDSLPSDGMMHKLENLGTLNNGAKLAATRYCFSY